VTPAIEALVAATLETLKESGADCDRVKTVITLDLDLSPDLGSDLVQVHRMRVLVRGEGVVLDVGGFPVGATPVEDPPPVEFEPPGLPPSPSEETEPGPDDEDQ
jgi:hypothetical protein